MQRPTRVRYIVLAVLCSLAFLTYLDRICISRVKGDMARDLNLGQLTEDDERKLEEAGLENDESARAEMSKDRSKKRVSWIISAFLWGYLLFEVPGGWLGDKFGPRAIILRVVLCWSIFTALTGSFDIAVGWFVSNPGPSLMLVCAVLVRFVFGLGEAGAYPNISLVLGRWFPFRSRAAAQGAIWMSSRFGGALSYGIIGWLVTVTGGWRQAFWVLGAIGVAWAFSFYHWFRNRPDEKAGVNEAERALIRSGAVSGEMGHGSVPWSKLLLSTNLWSIYLTAACVSYSWYFYVNYLPDYLKDRFDVAFDESQWQSGLPLLAGGIACLAAGRLSDYLVRKTGSKRWGRSLPGLLGFGGAGACNILMPSLAGPEQVIFIVCLAFALQDLAIPCLWSITADVGGRYTGTVAGCMNCIGGIGGALSPLIAMRVQIYFGWKAVFISNGIVYLIGALFWLRINAGETLDRKDKA
jgi:MFS family permease